MDTGGETKHYGYRFGEFRMFPAQRLLLRGDRKVEVRQTALSLVAYLVAHAGQILSHKQLITGAWGKTKVSETTLPTYIGIVRDLFGEGSLITLPTQGYQFTLITTPITEPPPEPRQIKSASAPTQGIRPALRIGRKAELAQAASDLAQSRLVTIVGPGGVGKTWLAMELGWRVRDRFPKGVHFIDLSQARDDAAIGSATAKALGIVLRGTKAPSAVIAGSLSASEPTLLTFDSCEYVAGAAGAFIQALLVAVPRLTVLATSQRPLNIAAEAILRQEPLSLVDAVVRFVKRVQAANRSFKPSGDNAASVEEICRRLDGIPLAIELAARLVRSQGLTAIRDGLKNGARFSLLEGGETTAAARQQTLLATVEWSYGLLGDFDQKVFARLSCFSGSFSREAAIAVAAVDGATQWDIGHALGRLTETSLLQFENGEPARYRFLETLHQYAARKLDESGETELVAERHLKYLLTLFEQADESWETVPDTEWARQYAPEIDNVRGVLDWSLAKPEHVQNGIALCGVAGRLWYMIGLVPEGRLYCERFLGLATDTTPASDLARLLRRSAMFYRFADRRHAIELMEQSADQYRELVDGTSLGMVLGQLGGNYLYMGRLADAERTLGEALQLLSGSNRTKSMIQIRGDLGSLAVSNNNIEEARRSYLTMRDLSHQVGDIIRFNIAVANLGEAEYRAGLFEQAIEYAREASRGFRAAGQTSYLAWALTNLVSYQVLRGHTLDARRSAEETLPLLIEQGGHWLRLGLQGWALIAALEGLYAEAAQLNGFVEADYRRAGEVREPTEQLLLNQLAALLTANLDPVVIDRFAAEGATWTEDRAADFVMHRIVSPDCSAI